MVLTQMNAHLYEVCSVAGSIASVMGQPNERREMIFGLCNDIGSAGRRQLRVHVISEDQLGQSPLVEDVNSERGDESVPTSGAGNGGGLPAPRCTDW